jgi:hypothetical protein
VTDSVWWRYRAPSQRLRTSGSETATPFKGSRFAGKAIAGAALCKSHFDGFFVRRSAALLQMIGDAMGKPVTQEADVIEQPSDYVEELPDVESSDSLVVVGEG